jgi:transcriptional regulator with XRE-family HTH domain
MNTNINLILNTDMHWYDKAKRIMKAKRIKQDELIDTFGVQTVGAVSHYLTGRRQPDPMQIKALADKLGCTVDELLSGGAPDPLQLKINRIIRAAEKAMATSTHHFTESEKISVYRAAFSAGLDLSVTDDLDMLLYAFIKK